MCIGNLTEVCQLELAVVRRAGMRRNLFYMEEERDMDKRELKKKLDFALRQVVREWRGEHWGKEKIFAMAFHIDYDNPDLTKRFACTAMIQTRRGCQEASGSEGELDVRYLSSDYPYAETQFSGLQMVQDYLLENSICLGECETQKDDGARKKMQETISDQTPFIEKTLIECIKRLRKEKFLTSDYDDDEFYVFPYIEESGCTEKDIAFAKAVNGGLDLMEYLEYMEKRRNIAPDGPAFDTGKIEPEKLTIHKDRKLDKRELKKKFSVAIRQMTEACLEKYGGEGLYAICFRMHYDSVDPDWRFACEVIVQTQTGCEETAQKGIEDGMGANFGRYGKYLPEEYKYAMDGLDGFRAVREYLYENCLNLEECEDLDDYDEREQMYEDIAKQSRDIENVLAASVADLRKEHVLTDHGGREFYVFPYIGEDDLPENYVPLAKKMNKGLDLKEYLKFIEEEFE